MVCNALDRLAAELGDQAERESGGRIIIVRNEGSRFPFASELDALRFLAYTAQWRDDREEIRERVGFTGPVSDVADGPVNDALRWLAGQGPAVERLPKRDGLKPLEAT